MEIKYEHIISLGFFCSVASELKRIGIRDCSSPFDWVISEDIFKIIQLINNNFKDFLSINYLEQNKNYPNYYKNIKYKIQFFHDFNEHQACEEQLPTIQEKYNRRINRLYENIKEPTLFIRYIYNQQEYDNIEKNIDIILKDLKKYNINNNIIFVANSDIKISKLNLFIVDKDKDKPVARTFLEKNKKLEEYLLNSIYK